MTRISWTFERLRQDGKTGLIAYLTVGDPSPKETPALVLEAAQNGADVIELGIPFSDPSADGPVIQAAMERALAAGTRLATVLECVRTVRQASDVPIVLFGYVNPLLQYGVLRFCRDAHDAGADGLLCVDVPAEEAVEMVAVAQQCALDWIPLVAPTSTRARIERAAGLASGFIYVVSRTGVTGSGASDETAVARVVGDIRAVTHLPVGLGFGIQTADDARAAARLADAIVVGSALVRVVAEAAPGERVFALGRAVAAFRAQSGGP